MANTAIAIANEFIRYGLRNNTPFTQMQLQKLVYIANGWSLALCDKPLTHDDPEAWQYGPVYRDLRKALRRYGSNPVAQEIIQYDFDECEANSDEPVRAILTKNDEEVIERVARVYGKFHAFQLSALTHKEGTPWRHIYNDGVGIYDKIPPQMIRDYFVQIAQS